MPGIGSPYILDLELPASLSVGYASGDPNLKFAGALSKTPSSGLVLVENELLTVTGFDNAGGGHHLLVSGAAYGTRDVAHGSGRNVYEVQSVVARGDSLLVYYFTNDDYDGQIEVKRIHKGGPFSSDPALDAFPVGITDSVVGYDKNGDLVASALELTGNGTDSLPADLTDSTTGVASVTSPPTLIAMRSDSLVNLKTDVAANIATLNAYIEALVDYIQGQKIILQADD